MSLANWWARASPSSLRPFLRRYVSFNVRSRAVDAVHPLVEAPGIEPGSATHLLVASFTGLARLLARPSGGTSDAKFYVPGRQVGTSFHAQCVGVVPVCVWFPDAFPASVSRCWDPIPQAARARGAVPLSLASVRHMGFELVPRAPVPAASSFRTTSKPCRPQTCWVKSPGCQRTGPTLGAGPQSISTTPGPTSSLAVAAVLSRVRHVGRRRALAPRRVG